MIYLYILLLVIAAFIILAALSCIVSGIVIGAVGTAILSFIGLFRKKEPLPYNPDIFPIIREEQE